MSYDPNKTVWFNPNLEYLFDVELIEYDMHDAGYSLIKEFQLLPQEEMLKLDIMTKGIDRHIAVGKLQAENKEFSKALTEKFSDLRRIFITSNGLSDDRIVAVKKDAIYTIGKCEKCIFGRIEFLPKNIYSSYIRFINNQNIELYYSDKKIDIKGISDSSINRHRLYLLEFLRKIIHMIENKDEGVKRYIIKFIESYKAHELEEEYYLEFNNLSKNINPVYNYQNLFVPLVQIIQKEMRG